MAKNYLLIYSEQLATDIEFLCQKVKAPSNTLFKYEKAQAVYMPTFAKLITGRAKQICFPNLKSPLKNAAKPRAGCSYFLIQIVLMKKLLEISEIFADALDAY